ncbi:MAG: Nif3-like dinuclear metal center hexameric protein [Saprospiraceae bacterium]|nr:Nif3-like dinuclear metal center hexameric protein [Saprospiraceae bacterium]
MQIRELTNLLESVAPLDLQESYDNAGLITGEHSWEITGVMICLDMTLPVIEEAVAKGCNVVVGHHPIIFKGLRRINGYNYVEKAIIYAIRNGVALYAIHTNLDSVLYHGVNQKIAQILGLHNLQMMIPKSLSSGHPVFNKEGNAVGTGIVGELEQPVDEKSFLSQLKEKMQASCVRHTAFIGYTISKVSICGGSGSSFLPAAMAHNADVYVSADFKYHEFFDANDRILIADIGHFESEQYTMQVLYDLITENFSNFASYLTKVSTNPINYL